LKSRGFFLLIFKRFNYSVQSMAQTCKLKTTNYPINIIPRKQYLSSIIEKFGVCFLIQYRTVPTLLHLKLKDGYLNLYSNSFRKTKFTLIHSYFCCVIFLRWTTKMIQQSICHPNERSIIDQVILIDQMLKIMFV
jgi:hypothetical protein